jgi:hypothetical protein
MPKRNFINQKLPLQQPDCCAECPLLGIIPQEARKYGSYETLVCLGTMDAMTQRQSKIRASRRDSKHPLHRYCDTRWQAWTLLEGHEFPISIESYNRYRLPYEMSFQPLIRFHKRGRPRKGAAAQRQSIGRSGDGALEGHRTERSDEQETTNNNNDKNDYEN